MNLYKVLLVDDEDDVLHAMERKLDWEELGFSLAGTAGNGQEALELAEQLGVDVVMTDIQMPFMDGLALCRKLKENYRNMKVVIYSGFDEFEYAREAVHLEAEEYLLKPIRARDLEQVFRKLKENLDQEIDERRNLDKLNEYYRKSLPAMQEQLFLGIVEGKVAEDRIWDLLSTYELNLRAPYYAAALLQVEEERMEDARERELLFLSLREIARDYLTMSIRSYSAYHLQGVVVLFLLDFKEEIEEALYHLEQITKVGGKILGRKVTASAGQAYKELLNVNLSYREARDAMDYRQLLDSRVLYINDLEPSHQGGEFPVEFDFQELLRGVKLGDQKETEEAIRSFVENLRSNGVTPQQYQLLLMELLTELLKLGRSHRLGEAEIFGEELLSFLELQKLPSLETLENWLMEVCGNLRNRLRQERNDTTLRLAEQAKDYIEKHYRESDLSADILCRQLNVSATYFSTIFKKEVGLSFVAYLTKLRLAHAAELLRNTSEKTYVISEQVGYTEPNYFSYVFKKQYGISPSKYRAGAEETKER